MIALAVFATAALAALSQGVESSPIIVAILALLALPGVTSVATSAIRTVSDAAGVNPRVVVYVLSLAITGVILGSSNLAGYFKCSKEAKKQLQSMGQQWGANIMSAAVQNRFQAALARV